MRVLLVTTWDTSCGIAEHSAMLKDAVEAADPTITISPNAAALDPLRLAFDWPKPQPLEDRIHLVHLNYHAALHSRWTPDWIRRTRETGIKVLVTYHDSGVPNSDQCKQLVEAADAAVVHEPFDDLPPEKTHYWRMGVPEWTRPMQVLMPDARPILGTIGFPAPHKNYDMLAEVTADAGWGLLLLAPGATVGQAAEWERRNPSVIVRGDFTQRDEAISLLSSCDATVFFYTCAFAGQSGALPLGIAARKPVIALRSCRQFRALQLDDLGSGAIRWVDNDEDVLLQLTEVPIQRCDPGIVALAKQDSWQKLGAKYAALYKELAA